MTEREKQALANFAGGDNCAQSVLKAYCGAAGLTEAQASCLAAGFGGGMGRLRLDCGAFSAAVMLACAMEGPGSDQAGERARLYARVQRIHQEFVAALGTVNCAQLLGRPAGAQEPAPEARTAAYYAARPCARIIRTACEIIERQLAEREGNGQPG